MMADNDMLNEIITAKKSRRITFQTMMKNFQENMDLHLYPDEEIYSKLNETIKETDKDYKEQKRKFNKIIEAFCFDDAKMIFRKDDDIGDRGKDKWCYVKITDTLNLYFLGKSAKCTKWSHLFHGLLDNEPLMA